MRAYYEKKERPTHFFFSSNLTYQKHLHNHVELILPLSGSCDAFADEKGGRLSAGQIFLSFPNQIHFYPDNADNLQSIVLIFLPNVIPAFQKIFTQKIPEYPIFDLDLARLQPFVNDLANEVKIRMSPILKQRF